MHTFLAHPPLTLLQPTLADERVRVRPLQKDDLEALYTVASDPNLWEQHWARDRYRREVFEVFFTGSLTSGGAVVVEDRKTGGVIGHSRFQMVAGQSDAVEIGWTFLDRAYWGSGYNAAFKHLMIDHARNFVRYVVFYVADGNQRSQRAVEKLGGRSISSTDPLARLRKPAANYTSYVL